MDKDIALQRVRKFQNQDFTPVMGRENGPTAEERQATALEYIAYQLGRIRQMMEDDRTKGS